MQEKCKRFTHWTCPDCQLVIPNYKNSWDSMMIKVRNHLQKFHYGKYSRQQTDTLLDSLWCEYRDAKTELG